MPQHRTARSIVLAAAVTVTLVGVTGQTLAAPAPGPAAHPKPAAAPTAAPTPAPTTAPTTAPNPHDEVDRLARAPKPTASPAPAPGGRTEARVPGAVGGKATARARGAAPARTLAGVPCTLDGITGLSPERFADFLADPAVKADGCLRELLWTWDARLVPVMSDAHVQAVSRRAESLAAGHDGTGAAHLEEMFTYLHAVAYHDFSRTEIDVTDAPTVDAMRRAVAAFGTAPRTFDVTASNANTLREALYAASSPGLRQHQLPLIVKVLATMGPDRPATHKDAAWAGAALAALSVNYLGVYPGNQDSAFHAAVAADPAYRAAFRAFAGHTHLKGTANAWVVRDALSEYGRFGQISGLRDETVRGVGGLVAQVSANFGEGSGPWASLVNWLNYYDACAAYGVCKADIEARIFPNTYVYDGGAIKVRTGLDRATVDQLYYASKQVKAQFLRVLGTETPLAGDPNTSLNIVLYASRSDYEVYHPILTGMGTENGGVYIESGATFYTYQRRVPQDSSLTLEELFRHEYTHYLNGRWAVPGFFGEGPWYEGDRTTAMDEGTAEFFAGSTRDNGVAVRKSLVRGVINDTAGGGPRMSVRDLLHAEYERDGFRFYNYAGTFFEFLWTRKPAELRRMYTLLRAGDVAGYDAWRDRLSADTYLQRDYDRFLDERIAEVDRLYVPNTTYNTDDRLRETTAAAIRSAFAAATSNTPDCVENGGPGKRRFTCTGRITANLADWRSEDKVFQDMSETVDYFILDRAGAASPNLADMNCRFGGVEIWSNKVAGTADFACDGPLRG
ncbi:collagenase [Streptomyces sp. BI20]|uniref:collagenase n=1 Tax=Streptomyces sp. BI20 TaxID=3403460 RepID=UPI003C766315